MGEQPKSTVKFKTPVGDHAVEIKGMVTGFDQETIDREHHIEGELPAEQRANRKSFETLVVSVNGSTDGVVDAVMSMDVRDYHFIIGKINDLTGPLSDGSKKKSSTSDT